MAKIDGYGYTSTIDPADVQQVRNQKEISVGSAGQVAIDADAAAYLKTGGKASLPEFAGEVQPGSDADGKDALELIGGNIGIDYTAILALIIKLSSEQRRASSEATVTDILAVAEQTKVAADDIRSGAGIALAGGILSSTINIGAGLVSVGGGIKALSMASGEAGPAPGDVEEGTGETAEADSGGTPSTTLEEVTGETDTATSESAEAQSAEVTDEAADTAREDISEAQQNQGDEIAEMKKSFKAFTGEGRSFMLSQRAHSISAITGGISSTLQGVAGGVGSMGKFGSDMYQARSKDDEAKAQQMQAALEKEKEYGRSMADDVKKIMDVFSQIDQARHDTQAKIMDTI